MAQPHVVTALVEKRSELAGLVEFHRREITRIGADLANLNATIKIFAPDFNLAGIGVKRIRIGKGGGFKHFKQGESQTLVLDLLRVAEQPLTVAMLAAQLIANKGLEDVQDVRISIQRTLSGTLRLLKERGFVVEAGKDCDGLTVFWRIAYPQTTLPACRPIGANASWPLGSGRRNASVGKRTADRQGDFVRANRRFLA